MKSILDPSFKYTKSIDTDLRKTFARVRGEMKKAEQRPEAANVRDLATIRRRPTPRS